MVIYLYFLNTLRINNPKGSTQRSCSGCQWSSWAKQSCSKTALNHWISTEIRWNKKLASVSSS